jgi:hypothetical protein
MKIKPKKIAFTDWHNDQQKQLNAFNTYWHLMNDVDPENFPMELLKGDWYEQFDLFVDSIYSPNFTMSDYWKMAKKVVDNNQ